MMYPSEALLADTGDQRVGLPAARSLTDFSEMQIDHSKTLLGDRFLCVGGGCLFIGPTGVGKTSASVQQDILWALGREAFGIRPSRPLRILTIQSENDDGDLIEITRGIMTNLKLTASDREIVRRNTSYISYAEANGLKFLEHIAHPLLQQYRPDLLRLDPLHGFLGGDPVESQVLVPFLRGGLTSLVKAGGCGVILNHHTPKSNNRNTASWSQTDWAYAGAGGAELANWARAILVIEPLFDGRTFRFMGTKRAARIGWRDEDDQVETARYFRHSPAKDGIFWVPASQQDVSNGLTRSRKRKPSKSSFLELFPKTFANSPEEALLTSAQLREKGRRLWTDDDIASMRTKAVEEGWLSRIDVGRNKSLFGRPEVVTAFCKSRAAHSGRS